MAVETFVNDAVTTIFSGGGSAPSSGTPETWVVNSLANFPVISNSAIPPTQLHIVDPAQPTELIAVTNMSGTGNATWAVTRGAENTTPVAHAAGFTVKQVLTAGGLTQIQSQLLPATIKVMPPPSGDTTGATDLTNYQNAVNPLISAGGILQFQAGRYYIAQLLLYPSVEYWGASGIAPITGATGTIITAPIGSNQDMVVPNASNITSPGMRFLALDGNNGTNGAVLVQAHQFNGINLNVKVSRAYFESLEIMNVPGDGIVTAAGNSYSGSIFQNIRIHNPYAHGVNLNGSDIHLHDVEVYPPGLSCFLINATTVQASLLKSNYGGSRGVQGDTYGIAVKGNSCNIGGATFAQNDVGSFQSPQTFTATNASPCVFTVPGTAFQNVTPIVLTGASLPTGFTAGTVYYTVASAGSTFELAATPGGTAINSSSTGSGTATPYDGVSIYVSGSRNRIDASAAGSSNALLYLDSGASDCSIDLQCTNQQNTTNPNFIYVINNANVKNNRVRITGQSTFLSAFALLTNGGSEQNNQFSVEGEEYGTQNINFASSITPDPYNGGNIQIGTLTGAITINNPVNGHAGSRIIFRLLQDGTGGRVVTFGGAYKTAGAIPTTASTATQIMFVLDGGGTWRETARATA